MTSTLAAIGAAIHRRKPGALPNSQSNHRMPSTSESATCRTQPIVNNGSGPQLSDGILPPKSSRQFPSVSRMPTRTALDATTSAQQTSGARHRDGRRQPVISASGSMAPSRAAIHTTS